jgi:chromosomal replication initiation ATPase DnaA
MNFAQPNNINPQYPMSQFSMDDNNSLYTVTFKITEDGQNILKSLEQFICREFNITEESLRSEARYMPLPRARGTFTSILRSKFDFPLKMIGLYLGGRDHSTILMAEQRVKDFYKKNDKYRVQYDKIDKSFTKFLSENKLTIEDLNEN